MKKTVFLAVLGLWCLSACGNSSSSSDLLSANEPITDMVGREVTIDRGSYSRIVCIGAGALRLYSYVGGIDWLAGVEDIDNPSAQGRPKMFDNDPRPYYNVFGSHLSSLPSCGLGGPNAQAPEAEKILACNPDLVFSCYSDVDKANALQEQLGVPVITLRIGGSGVFDSLFYTSLRLIGEVIGKEERAAELLSYLESQAVEIETASAAAPEDDKDKQVYIGGLGNWGTTNHLMTAQNYAPFNIAHVTNVVNDLPKDGIQAITAEKFAALAPSMDIMFLDSAAIKNIQPLLAENPNLFDGCEAWENGQVYLQMAYNSYYTNLELALANTKFIAATVHPENCSFVPETEIRDIFEHFYPAAYLSENPYGDILALSRSYGGYQKIDPKAFFAAL